MQYQITWGGEVATIAADRPGDAWAKFCEKHPLALKHPNMHERTVTPLDENGVAIVEPAAIETDSGNPTSAIINAVITTNESIGDSDESSQ